MAGERLSSPSSQINAPINLTSIAGKVLEIPPMATLSDLVKDYYRNNAPMRDKLDHPSERPPVNDELKNTTAHETQHALVLRVLGHKSSISLDPQGDSLARTIPHGAVPLSDFKIAAAAGAVDTVGAGPARGFGSDLYQVGIANWLQNISPNNFQPAINAASKILKANYPDEIRVKTTDIVAQMGGTNDIDLVLEQAYFEAELEGINFDEFYQRREQILKEVDKILSTIDNPEERNIYISMIEENQDHTVKIVFFYDDKPEELFEHVSCPHCGGINNHAQSCTTDFRLKNQEPIVINNWPVEKL